MMNIYTSNTSDIIRNDFLKFSAGTAAPRATSRRVKFETELPAVELNLDDLRAEMADDDGQGSFASYKSSIF